MIYKRKRCLMVQVGSHTEIDTEKLKTDLSAKVN